MSQPWVDEVIAGIDRAISDRAVSKADLAEGLEEIAEHARGWAEQQRMELDTEDAAEEGSET